jgi:hypothetical protein
MQIKLADGFFETDTATRYDEEPKGALFMTARSSWVLAVLDGAGAVASASRVTPTDAIAWFTRNSQAVPDVLSDPVNIEV